MKITKLADPGDCDLRHVQNFTSNPAYMSPLTGLDGDIWGTERFPEGRSPDLFTVRARHDEDIFSKWFTDSFMAFFFKHKGDQYVSRSSLYGEVVFNERRLLRGAFIVVSILTSQLPIISIVVLYFVENPLVRLGIISGFAFLVTLCLILFTKARAVDIFLVAAA
jgi:hypothetical protein